MPSRGDMKPAILQAETRKELVECAEINRLGAFEVGGWHAVVSDGNGLSGGVHD